MGTKNYKSDPEPKVPVSARFTAASGHALAERQDGLRPQLEEKLIHHEMHLNGRDASVDVNGDG
jgi:hypothetical protein